MAGLRIRHTLVTHTYPLKGEEAPICIPCQELYTVNHILISCIDFKQTHLRLYQVINLKKICDKVNLDNLFGFLKATKLYKKI